MPDWESENLPELQKGPAATGRCSCPCREGGRGGITQPAVMLRREYPTLSPPRIGRAGPGEAVRDASDTSGVADERFSPRFQSHAEKVAYHAPCHLGPRRWLPGAISIRRNGGADSTRGGVGSDGTFAIRWRVRALRRRSAKAFTDEGAGGGPNGDRCPLAALPFQQPRKETLHTMYLLARALRGCFARQTEGGAGIECAGSAGPRSSISDLKRQPGGAAGGISGDQAPASDTYRPLITSCRERRTRSASDPG